MCDFPISIPQQTHQDRTRALPRRPYSSPAALLLPRPGAMTRAFAFPPPSKPASHSKTRTPPGSAVQKALQTCHPPSQTSAAAPQSSNATPAKSHLQLQYKSACPTASKQQLFPLPRSPLAVPLSATKTDSQSAHAPPAAPEPSSPAPQCKP